MGETATAYQALEQTLDALREKEAKLLRVREALAKTRREIRLVESTLRRLNGGDADVRRDEQNRRREAIKQAVTDAPLTKHEISEVTGFGMHGIWKTLVGMVDRGELAEADGDRYAIPQEATSDG